jgi:hypothetical protein
MQKHNCKKYVQDGTLLAWLKLWDGLARHAWGKVMIEFTKKTRDPSFVLYTRVRTRHGGQSG